MTNNHHPFTAASAASLSLQNRILQSSGRNYYGSDGGDDDEPTSMLLTVIVLALFIMLLICVIKKSSSRRIPPREVILEQRRRQRALIRRERLRQMGIDTSSGVSAVERIQLTAAQAEVRRHHFLQVFQSENIQTVIEEENLLKEKENSNNGTDEEQPQKCVEFVRLPHRKPQQPDRVPNNCAICLESFDSGEMIVWSDNAECQHAFHQDCILDYLVPLDPAKTSPCPVCRQTFCIAADASINTAGSDPPGFAASES